MYTLNNLLEFSDENKYLIEQFDCVERPLYVAAHSYNNKCSHLYLMFLKLSQSYNLGNEYKKLKYSFERSRYIMEKEIGIKFGTISSIDIVRSIEKALDENKPVFVLVNLRNIYYSDFYQKKDWLHLFLVKGYDRDKKIFYIMDNIHRTGDNEKLLYNFAVQYDTLVASYHSYCKNIYDDYIYYIDNENSSVEEIVVIDTLIRCIKCYLNTDYKYYLINDNIIKECCGDVEDLSKSIIKMDYYREVFFRELYYLITCFIGIEDELIDSLERMKDKLVICWKRNSSLRLFAIRKNKSVSYDDVDRAESEMRLLLKVIVERLSNTRKVNLLEYSEIKRSLANNTDNIIKFSNSNKICFNFSPNKVYNNWFTDESPKVIYQLNSIVENLYLETCVDFVLCEESSDIVAGIYIKTKNNQRYVWGSKSGEKIVFENTGVDSEVLSIECNSWTLKLSVSLSNDNLSLCYYDELGRPHIQKYDDVRAHQIEKIGVVCKTWNLAKRYSVEFEITEFSVNSQKVSTLCNIS